ncbi:MAG: CPBP family intramembrane metalloprotease [Anaerolineae bacterium]|nr:CPBP family intramembrane metalloprotease [Anaerolineae bacterium]
MTIFVNPAERRLRLFWRLLFLIITLLAVTLFAELIARVLTGGSGILAGAAFEAVLTLIIFGFAIWIAGLVADRRPFAEFGLRFSRDWWRQFAFGLLLGAVLMVFVFGVQWLLGWIEIEETFVTTNAAVPFAIAIWQPIVLFICVGIYEELLVRGYLLKNIAEGFSFSPLLQRGGVVVAYVFTSVLFGIMHLGNPGATVISTVNIALAGFFLGLGVLLTGELAIPIGIHITWNFFQGNIFGMAVSGTNWVGATVIQSAETGPDLWTGGIFGPEAGLIGIAAMVLGSLATIWYVRRRQGNLTIQDEIAVYKPIQLPAKSPASAASE